MYKALNISIVVLLLAGTSALGSRGYWDDSMPAKWVQDPDVIPPGNLAVYASRSMTLADDFQCTTTGPITEVHIWGAWSDDRYLGDYAPHQAAEFHLSFYADIPVGPNGWSVPGDLLWECDFSLSYTRVEPTYPFLIGGWHDPRFGDYCPSDHFEMWHYWFDFEEAGISPFVQEGTTTNPMVYWLGVNADPTYWDGIGGEFGWHTSCDHFRDDAVFTDSGPDPGPDGWFEMRHPETGESLDLAFVIVPEPATLGILLLGGLALLKRRRSS